MKNKLVFFVFGVILLLAGAAGAAFKCWTNKDGVRECGNSLPPEYVKQRVEYLSEKSGRVRKVKEAAKTAEQIAAEERQRRLERQKQKALAKQTAYDNVLLKTYLTIDDLLLSLHWKITTLDSRIQITKGRIDAERKKFINASRRAARFERQGKKIPQSITDSMKENSKTITHLKNKIKLLQEDKKAIYKKFEHDSVRFMAGTINFHAKKLKRDESAREMNMIQIRCVNKQDCDQKWRKAKQFIDQHSKLKIVFENDQIKTTTSAKKPEQLAYVVVRVNNKYKTPNQETITLQIRCQQSTEGDTFCKGDTVSQQLAQFKQFMR